MGNGNRTYQKVNGVERWLSYDAEDRLDKVYSDSTHTPQVAEYDYDVDGFLTTKTEGSDVTTYDYNSQGHLLEVVLPDTTEIEYLHDALGRRLAKVVDSGLYSTGILPMMPRSWPGRPCYGKVAGRKLEGRCLREMIAWRLPGGR